ncbi:MAG TPA: phosphatidylglycerol lysyltransferase domain-containing protein [Thermomicrobiales bacterium]
MGAGTREFRRFGPEDIGLIRRATERFAPYSDVHPLGVLAWNAGEGGELAMVNGNLAFKLRQYDGDGFFLTFVGTHEVAKTMRRLLRSARDLLDVDPHLRRVPEVAVRHTAGVRARFAVTPAPEDYDYVFGVEDLAALRGPEFGEKRTAIRRLQAETAAELRPIDVREPYARALMLDLFDRWASAKGVVNLPETGVERRALQRLCALAGVVGEDVIGLALFDAGGSPLGFCTAEVLARGYAMGHFEKTDPAWPGVSALMRQRIAQYLWARGCRYLNGEQDLGDPGLRASKASWAPRFYLRKYTIAEA